MRGKEVFAEDRFLGGHLRVEFQINPAFSLADLYEAQKKKNRVVEARLLSPARHHPLRAHVYWDNRELRLLGHILNCLFP